MWRAMEPLTSPLRVDSRADGADAVVVTVAGEIDMTNGDRLERGLLAALGSGAGTVAVDLGEVSFLDSTAINTLIRAHHQAAADGRRLVVTRVRPFVRHVLEITGVLDLLSVPPE